MRRIRIYLENLHKSAATRIIAGVLVVCCAQSAFSKKNAKIDFLPKLKELADGGDARAQVQLGEIFLSGSNSVEKDYFKAVYWFSQAAKQEMAIGVFYLGQCYEKGLGVEQDIESAIKLYILAADKDLVVAQRFAGLALRETAQLELALKYFEMGAENGDIDCLREFGSMLIGRGGQRSIRKGIRQFERAISMGDARAMVILADCYSGNTEGITRNAEAMLQHLWAAASIDWAAAQSKIGYCYEEGIGLEKNTELAVKWYNKAAEQDYPQALINLAHCYAVGKGVPMDNHHAFKLYSRAADLQFPAGIFNVGMCYSTGLGVEQDDEKAIEFFLQAAELNQFNAQHQLGNIYASRADVDGNPEKAFYWYGKAAEHNDATALRSLGMCYLNGVGTTVDAAIAGELFRKSAALDGEISIETPGKRYSDMMF